MYGIKGKKYPHNHKWDFYSKVISGYIEQRLYREVSNKVEGAFKVRRSEPVSLMPRLSSGDLPCPCRDKYALNPKLICNLPSKKETEEILYLHSHSRERIGVAKILHTT